MNKLHTRNHVIYGNCRVHHPDGTLMFLCLEKRARWYLDRGLATVTAEDPLTIQLNFEPKGKGGADQEDFLYALGEKKNSCVVCGSEDLETLTRHHVVPYEYRKFFPEEFKARSGHDIVAICREDHDIYENAHATKLKRNLEKELGVESADSVYKSNSHIAKAHSYAKLLMDPDRVLSIPEGRVQYFMKEIKRVFGKKNLAEIVEINVRKITSERMETVARQVVEKLEGDPEKIQDFIEMWRKHFLENMNPRHMPEGWRVEHRTKGWTRSENQKHE